MECSVENNQLRLPLTRTTDMQTVGCKSAQVWDQLHGHHKRAPSYTTLLQLPDPRAAGFMIRCNCNYVWWIMEVVGLQKCLEDLTSSRKIAFCPYGKSKNLWFASAEKVLVGCEDIFKTHVRELWFCQIISRFFVFLNGSQALKHPRV